MSQISCDQGFNAGWRVSAARAADGPSGGGSPTPALSAERRRLAAAHVGLVGVHLRRRVPRLRMPRCGREYEELFQEGCLALVQAAARYDPARHGSFPAYALPRIRGAIHSSIRSGAALIHIPYRAAYEARIRGAGAALPRCRPAGAVNLAGVAAREEPPRPEGETLRHALRERVLLALSDAREQLGRRLHRKAGIELLLRRITEERILTAGETERTSVRRLAREAGSSSSRVLAYEQELLRITRERLGQDARVRILVGFARRDPLGYDGDMTPTRRQRLLRGEARVFARRFASLSRREQADALLLLVEKSGRDPAQVARQLLRRSLSGS